jgi:hypothetical protein
LKSVLRAVAILSSSALTLAFCDGDRLLGSVGMPIATGSEAASVLCSCLIMLLGSAFETALLEGLEGRARGTCKVGSSVLCVDSARVMPLT